MTPLICTLDLTPHLMFSFLFLTQNDGFAEDPHVIIADTDCGY